MALQTMRRAALQDIETLSMLYENLETEAGIRSLYHSIDGKISMISLLDIITAQEVNTLTECNIDRQQAALRKLWTNGWKKKNKLNSLYGRVEGEAV